LVGTDMKKRVLVVDDVEFNLEFEQNLIMLYADEAGISVEVDTATTVREAKSKIENNELYDVMVIDMNLPDGSGVDIAKAALAKSDVTRIAAITIYPDKYESYHAYFDLFLKKPISPEIYKDDIAALMSF